MADYFPVISKAIAGLSPNTAETRRAVYERARQAIVRQLRAIEPPVSEDEIAQQRLNLEEAIRKVEAQQAAVESAPPPSAPVPAAPRTPDRPVPPAPHQAKPQQATPQPPAPQQATPKAAPRPPAKPEAQPSKSSRPQKPEPGAKGLAGSGPATRSDGRPIIKTASSRPAASSKRSGPVIALGVLALVAIAAGVFAARGPIMSMISGGGSETAVAPVDTPASQGESKSADRLPQDGDAAPAETPSPNGKPAEDRAATAEPKPAEPKPAEPTPAEPKPAEPAQEDKVAAAPAQPPAEQPATAPAGPLVAQRAVLYEEGPNQQSGEALSGSVLWRTESVNGGANQPLDTALRGEIDIPGRNLKAALILRRNLDATLPASHTIEVQFTLPSDFPNAGVSNVPGVLMKADEAARGTAVAGLSVRVTNGFFLIGLSNLDSEKTVNEQLLKDRGWIDVPILYDNGRRAVLTLEKGTPGTQAFNQAFDAWKNAPATAANPSR